VAAGLDDELDLEYLAREAALSQFHFHRVLRGMLGETPPRCTGASGSSGPPGGSSTRPSCGRSDRTSAVRRPSSAPGSGARRAATARSRAFPPARGSTSIPTPKPSSTSSSRQEPS
jgi:hypothetical protein